MVIRHLSTKRVTDDEINCRNVKIRTIIVNSIVIWVQKCDILKRELRLTKSSVVHVGIFDLWCKVYCFNLTVDGTQVK